MGVAGVAMMFALFFLYKSFVSIYNYFIWRNKEIVEGTFGCLQNVTEEGKIKKLTYALSLRTPESVVLTEYIEVIEKSKSSQIKEGDKTEFFYDPSKKQFRMKEDIINNLWVNPVMCACCVALFILCYIFISALG